MKESDMLNTIILIIVMILICVLDTLYHQYYTNEYNIHNVQ